MSEFILPKEFEMIITYLDENDTVCKHNVVYKSMDECMQQIKHFRVKTGCEIIKYEIIVQRVLF